MAALTGGGENASWEVGARAGRPPHTEQPESRRRLEKTRNHLHFFFLISPACLNGFS